MTLALVPKTYPESEWVASLVQRDSRAFEYLYDAHSAALYGLCLQILQDESLAEAAVQEAFVRIWRKIHAYDLSKGSLFTWMLNMTRKLAIEMRHAAGPSGANIAQHIAQPDIVVMGPVGQDSAERTGLREFVDLLSPEQRLLVDVVYFQGFTQQDAAEALGLPLDTVKSRLCLAMNHLRNALP